MKLRTHIFALLASASLCFGQSIMDPNAQVTIDLIKAAGSQANYLQEVARGNVKGQSLVHKFGKNSGVPNGSFEFVTILGHTEWPLAATTTVRIAVGNAADTAAGAGAREITLQGLDHNLDAATSILATAGGSASVSTTTKYWRVNRAWVSAVGTYGGANTGAVTIENTAGTTNILQIAAGEGQSQHAAWSVPEGKTAYLLSVHLTVDASKAADIKLCTRANLDDVTAPMPSVRIKKYWDGVVGKLEYTPASPNSVFVEKSDIWIEAQGGGAGTEVSADFELLLVDN